MTQIYVDIDELRWQISNLEVHLWSIRQHALAGISQAMQMATGYEGQLERQVMAIAGEDESRVRSLANDTDPE